jgi:endoglucanase
MFSQGLKTSGKIIVDENGNEVLLRGYTPGGWLVMEGYMMQSEGTAGAQHEFVEKFTELVGEEKTNQFFAKWRENHFMQEDVDSLAAWGFNSIRVPLHYNLFTLPIQEEPNSDQNTWLETGFDIIDNVLEWAEPHQMYVILDMHAAPGGQGRNSEISDYDPSKPSLWESERNKTKLVQLWKKIAERYKDNKWIGGYDLINETNWDLPGGVALRDIYERITTEIRGVGDNHILFIEGNDYGNNHAGLTPPWDDNMVYSFHKYWNSTNENDLDWILPLRDNYNVPLWMGESGENSNKWYTDAVHLFESNNVGWAWWAIKKLGDIDSAFSVIKNPGYQDIINYWKGEGDKPSEDDAFAAMMKLADNLLIKNCLYRKGIKDALLRQPHTDETIPYIKPQEIPGVVYLSDYDLGKNGHAYYDVDAADYNLSTGSFQAWNSGWSYRNDGVDIETNDDNINSNGYHIGFVNKGEWIKYTVDVKNSGLYKLKIRHASNENGGKAYFTLDDQNLTSVITTNSTNGWFNFVTTEINGVVLESGLRTLKLFFDSSNGLNMSSVQFERIGEISQASFSPVSGKTASNEKSVELYLNQAIDESTISSAAGDFTVSVNGENINVTSASFNQSKSRTITINLQNNLLFTDEILISYSGDKIKSKSGKNLETFSSLVVVNDLEPRYVLPGKIEVENYVAMSGISTESTEDVGGGYNIGYTDGGDYADYKVFNETSRKFTVDFRVASNSDGGKVALYVVEESTGRNFKVSEDIDLPVTNGWQEWTNVTANLTNNIPQGVFLIRLKIIDGGFNMNWINFREIDSDSDGVSDSNDNCPNTPQGTRVDVNGCPVFELPLNNFKVEVGSATCIGNSDGVINLSVEDASYDYSVTVTGQSDLSITGTSTTASVTGLAKGTYEVCFKVVGQDGYEQCFEVVVGEPKPLSAFIDVDSNSGRMSVTMGGSSMYYVNINGVNTRVDGDTFETELSTGLSIITISTDLECQGVVKQEVFISEKIHYYPNPTLRNVNVHVGGEDVSVRVSVFSEKGDLIYTRDQSIEQGSRKIHIDLTNQITGTYIVTLESKTVRQSFKIIRE